jgi:Asp/Glu/hydantoin racemase
VSLTLAFLHTSHVLIPMFSALAKAELPEARFFHMVDESLIRNTIDSGGLTRQTVRRMAAMVASAHDGGADAVMVTCSSIGPAVTTLRALYDFPVLRVDEAMAEEAVRMGTRIGVAATLGTTLQPTVALLRDKAAEAGRDIDILECLCEGAFQAVLAGDTATHDRLVAASLTDLRERADVIVLAQASMARVVAGMSKSPGDTPILASPELAMRNARAVLFSEECIPVG